MWPLYEYNQWEESWAEREDRGTSVELTTWSYPTSVQPVNESSGRRWCLAQSCAVTSPRTPFSVQTFCYGTWEFKRIQQWYANTQIGVDMKSNFTPFTFWMHCCSYQLQLDFEFLLCFNLFPPVWYGTANQINPHGWNQFSFNIWTFIMTFKQRLLFFQFKCKCTFLMKRAHTHTQSIVKDNNIYFIIASY